MKIVNSTLLGNAFLIFTALAVRSSVAVQHCSDKWYEVSPGHLHSVHRVHCVPVCIVCSATNQAISFIIISSVLPPVTLLTRPHYKHYIILILFPFY